MRGNHMVGQLAQRVRAVAVAKCSNMPKRTKLGATRVTTAAVSQLSRCTGVREATSASARLVGNAQPGHGF